MLLVGDVHGKVDKFWKVTQKHMDNHIIQVGDFGFKDQHDWFLKVMNTERHKVLFGNHDYYPYLNKEHSLGNFAEFNGCFCIRGAYSIDQHLRTEGIDWFREEELTYAETYPLIDVYEKTNCNIVVSHDCPEFLFERIHDYRAERSITRSLLQSLWETKQPDLWVFGHHHKSFKEKIDGTTFICLAELEVLEV